ncbi:hypothetical protein O181_035703 [Austropuccinia psidii MF-1]|uniref:Tc1-like transposase DDE domain-containing protein n=1 Tax=Austropuccinia psidii MF-1 TaxID=1389203 RepID=A0A9Q3D804_9BASI|nr:hypothetical protein [Austropuccinia psidii MF-1]
MKKGVGSDEFVLFLLSLQLKVPNDPIIIIDNALIHQGRQFDEVKEMLEFSKVIKLEFLPPYYPFLNPIELRFNSLKSFAHSKEPKTQSEPALEIQNGISEAITSEKRQNYFCIVERFIKAA